MTLATYRNALRAVQERIAEKTAGRTLRICEAGGGSASFMDPELLKSARVTVVDIDAAQLEKNTYADEKILGDLETHRFAEGSFDLIVCYNVIEHLNAPDKAVRSFFQALVPGGVLFIGAPNPNSFTGWVTRLTPHWFHVMYYRHVLGEKLAGTPGHMPYPIVYHPVAEPHALQKFCRDIGFDVIHFNEYEGEQIERITIGRPVLGKALDWLVDGAGTVRKGLRNTDFHILLEKPASTATDRLP